MIMTAGNLDAFAPPRLQISCAQSFLRACCYFSPPTKSRTISFLSGCYFWCSLRDCRLLLPWRALDTMTVNAMITRKLQNVWSKGVDDSYYKFVSRFFKHCVLLSYLVHCIGVFVLAFSSLSTFD